MTCAFSSDAARWCTTHPKLVLLVLSPADTSVYSAFVIRFAARWLPEDALTRDLTPDAI